MKITAIDAAKTAYLVANLAATRAVWDAACLLPGVLSLCTATVDDTADALRRETIAHLRMLQAEARLRAQECLNYADDESADLYLRDTEHYNDAIEAETERADQLNCN